MSLVANSCEDTIMLPERACRWAQSQAKSCEDTITLPERACRWEQSQAKSYEDTVTSTCRATPRHLPRQKPYQKHPRSFHHGIFQDKHLTRSTHGAFVTAFANSLKNPRRDLNGKISFFFALMGSPTRKVAHQTFCS